jgi:hypothetical protein
MLFDEVGLQCGGNFVDRLERLVDGPFPSSVVNHDASIRRARRGSLAELASLIRIGSSWAALWATPS